VVAGVVLGGQMQRLTNAPIRLQVHAVYGTVVFLLESVVFALIGLELPSLIRDLGAERHTWPLQALAVAGTLLTVRMLWVFPLSAAMQHRRGIGPISWRVPAVLSWAGTRGVLPLAAALSIPLTAHDGTPLPQRELVLVLTTAVVVFTLVLQGFTLAPVVRRSGIALEPTSTAREEANARDSLARAALTQLEQLRRGLQARVDHARSEMDEAVDPADSTATTYRAMRRALIEAEAAELQRLYDEHRISDTTRRRIQRALDQEDVGLGE
jgi:CPA1 family monovalent cation:H+ antiporter